MNDPDAGPDRVQRSLRLVPAAFIGDLAFVRVINPAQDLNQSGLPGSVLANQDVDFAAHDVQGDVVQSRHAREAFGDSAFILAIRRG